LHVFSGDKCLRGNQRLPLLGVNGNRGVFAVLSCRFGRLQSRITEKRTSYIDSWARASQWARVEGQTK